MEGRKEGTNKRLFFSHGNNSNSKDKNKNTATYIESGRERERTWAWILGIAVMRLTHSQKRIPPMSSAGRQFVF